MCFILRTENENQLYSLPKLNQETGSMRNFGTLLLVLVALSVLCAGCYPEYQQKVTLVTGGYGYEVGDIVLLDTQKEPEQGDIVQYDWELNNSSGLAMGPNLYLARIVGLPGDAVSFQEWSYKVNEHEIIFNRDDSPLTESVIWGSEVYDGVVGLTLPVPEDEFVVDRWIGFEFSMVSEEAGSSRWHNRFTVKREAVTGVLVKKLGHDDEFEEQMKMVVY